MSFHIEGDLIVQIPIAGESIAQYTASEPAEFFMDSIEGISITEAGRLVICMDVKEQYIKIYARNQIDEVTSIDIQLLESWTENFVEKDGTIMKIPRAGEMETIGGTLYDISTKETTIWSIRGASVVICIFIIYLYLKWKKK